MVRRALMIAALFSMSGAALAQDGEVFSTPNNRDEPRAQMVTPAESDGAFVGVWRVEHSSCLMVLSADHEVSGYSTCDAPYDRVRTWRAPPGLRGHTALKLLDAEGVMVWSGLRLASGAIVGGPRSAHGRLVPVDAGFDRNPPPD